MMAPSRDHPNYPTFLEETAGMLQTAAAMEMEKHAEFAQPYIGSKPPQPLPYTLRDTMHKLSGLSMGAELLAAIARARRAEMSPTLVNLDGDPLT